jgi:dihydroneopterin aldolase
MGDRIIFEDLDYYGYHGAKSEEKVLGQRFRVDLWIDLDLEPAGRSDDLSLTVNYSEVYRLVRDVVEGPSRDTLEAVAQLSAEAVLGRYSRVTGIRVRVKKPGAPIAGAHFGMVAVEIIRRRGESGHG